MQVPVGAPVQSYHSILMNGNGQEAPNAVMADQVRVAQVAAAAPVRSYGVGMTGSRPSLEVGSVERLYCTDGRTTDPTSKPGMLPVRPAP